MGVGVGAGVDGINTSQTLTTPYKGSEPKKATSQVPDPLTVFSIQVLLLSLFHASKQNGKRHEKHYQKNVPGANA